MNGNGICYLTTLSNTLSNVTNDREQLCNLLENNKITSLHLNNYTDINFYKRLFELLKIGTSVISLGIIYTSDNNNNNNDNKYYELLSDYLRHNIWLKKINITDNGISITNCKLLCEALKNNTTIDDVAFTHGNLNDDMCKYIINYLKVNKTLQFVRISCLPQIIDGKYIAELLDNETKLKCITFFTNIKNEQCMSKSLENNSNVTSLCVFGLYFNSITKNIAYYCERNMHNLKLKSLMIEDL
jgi:hypothetical protein